MRRGARLLAALALLMGGATGGLIACSDEREDPAPAAVPAGPTVDAAVAGLLATRADAVRTRNEPAFLDGVDPDNRPFRRTQARLFANLQELPLQAFGYDLHRVTLLPDGRVEAEITQLMQLRGYDAAPVNTPGIFTFRQLPGGPWALQSDHDEAFDLDHGVDLQPWELTRIEAEERGGILGIFDRRSIDSAYQVMAAVDEGVEAVAPRIPLPWSKRVVVYALSDVTMMASLDHLPGGDPERLEGVAFGVLAEPGKQGLASVRFMLHPRLIKKDDEERDRLIRHELTHVAIAERDDHVPTWLSEGMAEYVAAQSMPRADREISREAVEQAQLGLTALPGDTDFNGERSAANYGISWYACEVIVTRFGEEALWGLLVELGKDGGTPESEQDEVLQRFLGMDSAEIAAAAGRRIVRTFT